MPVSVFVFCLNRILLQVADRLSEMDAALGAETKWDEPYFLYGEFRFVHCNNGMRHLWKSSLQGDFDGHRTVIGAEYFGVNTSIF